MGEIPEAQRGFAEVFESAVDRLSGAVAGLIVVEERQDVTAAHGQGAVELADLDQAEIDEFELEFL